MRSVMLLVLGCVPFVATLARLYQVNNCIQFLKKLNCVFMQINFILSGSTPEVVELFRILSSRNIYPEFCSAVHMHICSGLSFSEAWKACLDSAEPRMLTKAEYDELLSFADSFGLGALEEQTHICNHYSSFCENEINIRERDLSKNGKLYISGSLLLGALVFIMMF